MMDSYTIHGQLEHLQLKCIGTPRSSNTKWEWLVNQYHDSCYSYIGHFDLLNYFTIIEESKACNLIEQILQPCGLPADKSEEH
uniref:splicing factor 3B subunit 5-like n=1 Tax=Jaculus jaculus TaxID=51337 RepID=UPI001E1B2D24|nr:splicing factor 3B subunit 5-like [Jaculus jaculus]